MNNFFDAEAMNKILSVISGVLMLCLCMTTNVFAATSPPLPLSIGDIRVPVNASGFQGVFYERKPDGGAGGVIPGVVVSFVREDGSVIKNVMTDINGRYRIDLAPGRYVVTATHDGYEAYSSAPGFFIVSGLGYQTGNIYLKKKLLTTILLIRYADKSFNQDQLSIMGQARAQELVHVAAKSGVKAIFATSTRRSQQTVQPLATYLQLTPVTYNASDYNNLRTLVFHHAGETVLIVAHIDTMQPIIETFGGDSHKLQLTGDEDDNLCVITVYGSGADKKASVVNLQYGQPSP